MSENNKHDVASFAEELTQVVIRVRNGNFVESEPLVSKVWGEYGEYMLAGHGEQTNEKCGEYFGKKGCLNVSEHNMTTIDGVNHRGKVPVKLVFCYCHKPSCPICYERGWAFREARRAEARLLEGKKHYGLVEHLAVSPSPSDYGLSMDALRRKAVKALLARGVIGGSVVEHAFRYHNRREARLKGGVVGWYFSPHIHCLGYVEGGFGRCRVCKKYPHSCLACDGFEGRTRRHFSEDGFIIKVARDRKGVASERRSILKTLSYELSHCSIKKNAKRATPLTWFGVVSYRKMKFRYVEEHKDTCPICGGAMVPVLYCGSKRIVTDRRDPEFKAEFEADYEENGVPVWFEKSALVPFWRREDSG